MSRRISRIERRETDAEMRLYRLEEDVNILRHRCNVQQLELEQLRGALRTAPSGLADEAAVVLAAEEASYEHQSAAAKAKRAADRRAGLSEEQHSCSRNSDCVWLRRGQRFCEWKRIDDRERSRTYYWSQKQGEETDG